MGRRAPGYDREMTQLGAEIARRRQVLELTQPQLAERAGISLDGLLRIEKGRSATTVVTLVQIARALGCGVGELVEPLDGGRKAAAGASAELELLLRGQPREVVQAATSCVRAVVKLGGTNRAPP